MQLSPKKKNFSFFSAFLESKKNSEYFQKKVETQRWFLADIIDWGKCSYLNEQKPKCQNTYRQTTFLKGPKHCLNPHDSILSYFYHSERESVPKTIFKKYLKSWECLLTCWQPITSNLSQYMRVFNATNLNSIISQSKQTFSICFSIFGIYIKFQILSKKSWASEVISFLNYRLEKAVLLQCPKSHVSEHLSKFHILKGPKHCFNLHGSIFVTFFYHSARKSASKTLF